MPEEKEKEQKKQPKEEKQAAQPPGESQNAEEEEKTEEPLQVGKLLTPEALVMLFFAVLLDIIGLILLCFALDDFWITDAIGIIGLGGWMLIRTGHVTTTKKAQKQVKKVGKKVLKRLGLATLVEIIPYVGDIAPCWTLAVYFELKNN
jgi:hypothetical protein